MPKPSMSKIFLSTMGYVAQRGVDSAFCNIARSHTYLQISLLIHNHMQKWFYPLISDLSGIDAWRHPGSKIQYIETVPFIRHTFLCGSCIQIKNLIGINIVRFLWFYLLYLRFTASHFTPPHFKSALKLSYSTSYLQTHPCQRCKGHRKIISSPV
jgi:hypothetical protein